MEERTLKPALVVADALRQDLRTAYGFWKFMITAGDRCVVIAWLGGPSLNEIQAFVEKYKADYGELRYHYCNA